MSSSFVATLSTICPYVCSADKEALFVRNKICGPKLGEGEVSQDKVSSLVYISWLELEESGELCTKV